MNKIDELINKIIEEVNNIKVEVDKSISVIAREILGNNLIDIVNEYEYSEYTKILDYTNNISRVNIDDRRKVEIYMRILYVAVNEFYLFRDKLSLEERMELIESNKFSLVESGYCLKRCKLSNEDIENLSEDIILKVGTRNKNIQYNRIYELMNFEIKNEYRSSKALNELIKMVVKPGIDNYTKKSFQHLFLNEQSFKDVFLKLMRRTYNGDLTDKYNKCRKDGTHIIIDCRVGKFVEVPFSVNDLKEIFNKHRNLLTYKKFSYETMMIFYEYFTLEDKIRFITMAINQNKKYILESLRYNNYEFLKDKDEYIVDMIEGYFVMNKLAEVS